ncbi:MAG: leucine-rich repeat protein, partial [Clostridia bacterium]|nr:leucine-rich repeat protein [Clostridia bacterium]
GCSALTEITIPEKCREIESFAFDRCFNLEAVHIGAGVKSIDYEAFDDCPKLTIYAPAGSYAETWANEHNIPFVAE